MALRETEQNRLSKGEREAYNGTQRAPESGKLHSHLGFLPYC
jgi:hypothetical protein